jgi:hypothetical protein
MKVKSFGCLDICTYNLPCQDHKYKIIYLFIYLFISKVKGTHMRERVALHPSKANDIYIYKICEAKQKKL